MRGFEAHTLNLHEDMVEVEYIFADKTGTLTQNELIFKEMGIIDGHNSIRSLKADQLEGVQKLTGAEGLFNCIALC